MAGHRFRLWFSVACILLIILQSVSFLVYFTKQEENSYSQKVELAGSLSKLAQEILKNAVIYKSTGDLHYADLVKENINEFDHKRTQITVDQSSSYYIGKSSIAKLEKVLNILGTDWSNMKTVVRESLDNSSKDDLNYLLEYQWRITSDTQSSIDLLVDLDKESQNNIALIQMAIVLIITIGVTGFWYFLHHYMISSAERHTAQQNKLLLDTVKSLCRALDANDPYTYGHSERVGGLSMAIAKEMGYDERRCFLTQLAGYLHDIGKLGIPNDVLNKKGGLSDDEYRIIQLHPIIGANIVAEVEVLNEVVEGILFHHERMDGSGYPYGLQGSDIPEMARIIALADAYDAMTSSRSYRQAMTHNVAVQMILENRGTQFDALIIDHFLKIAHHYNTIKLVSHHSLDESESRISAI